MDLIDREWVLNNPDKPSTFVDAVMCAPTVEAIPIEVLDKIRSEIEELKPHSHYTQEMKNKVLEIIDKHTKEGDA